VAFLTGWTKRAPITVDATKVGSGGVSAFPMLVPVTLPDAVIAGLAYTDGRDLRFCNDAADVTYPHELVSIDTVAKTCQVWVKVPTILSVADTVIYANIGNPAATMPSAAEQQATWASAVEAAWHFEQPTGAVLDSTENANNSTLRQSAYTASGKIDAGEAFVPIQRIEVPIATAPETGTVSIAAWVRSTSTVLEHNVIAGNQVCANRYMVGIEISTHPRVFWYTIDDGVGFQCVIDSAKTYLNQWHLLRWEWGGGFRIYEDGLLIGSAAKATSPIINGTWWLGNDIYDSRLRGQLDEASVTTASRNAAWALTEYNNQSAPGTFSAWGAVETLSSGTRLFHPRLNAGFNPRLY